MTLIDGAFLPANSVQQKVWRLDPDELYPSTLSLLREDVLCDASTHGEYLGKRLSDFADDRCFPFHHTPDGTVEATCDFTVPALSGVYRIPFRMLRTDDAGLIVSFGRRRYIDFCVADIDLPGDKQAVLRQAALAERLRHGPCLTRSWSPADEAALRGGTLVIAFASWSGSREREADGPGMAGGFAEFAGAFRRAGISHGLFVRDPLRAWYLRGIGDAGHSFESVVARLEEERARLRPARVITVGSSMGGYAAIRAGLALRADVVLAFGPQVVLAPSERAALALRPSPYDRSLAALDADGEAEGFDRTSLLDVVRAFVAAPPAPTQREREPPRVPAAAPPPRGEASGGTRVHVFAGGKCAGDVQEARLLEKAISGGRQAAALVSCSCTIVPGSDHAVAAAMKASGQLQEVLCRHYRG